MGQGKRPFLASGLPFLPYPAGSWLAVRGARQGKGRLALRQEQLAIAFGELRLTPRLGKQRLKRARFITWDESFARALLLARPIR